LCELMNAHLRTHHGVDQVLVRGLVLVRACGVADANPII
jgi:hypothetical protein